MLPNNAEWEESMKNDQSRVQQIYGCSLFYLLNNTEWESGWH